MTSFDGDKCVLIGIDMDWCASEVIWFRLGNAGFYLYTLGSLICFSLVQFVLSSSRELSFIIFSVLACLPLDLYRNSFGPGAWPAVVYETQIAGKVLKEVI